MSSDKADEKCRDDDRSGAEHERERVDVHRLGPRERVTAERPERPHARIREPDPQQATAGREHEAFRQQLTHEPSSISA